MKIGVYLTCQGKFFERLAALEGCDLEIIYAENYLLFQQNKPFPEAWRDVDAFIYQPVLNPPSDYYRDENVLENIIPPRAVRIRLPYVMYTGLFPWFEEPAPAGLNTAYGISWIEKDLSSFNINIKSAKDILNFEDADFESWHKMSLGILRDREMKSDISGLADFLEENLKTKSLFWTPNHPRGHLAYLLCAQSFRLLGLPALPETAIQVLDHVLASERSPILPCVKRALGLQRQEDIAFFKDCVPMTVRQYIERYISVRTSLIQTSPTVQRTVERMGESDYNTAFAGHAIGDALPAAS